MVVWGRGNYICSSGFGFLGFEVLFLEHLHNSIQDVMCRVTLTQPAGGKDLTKTDSTTIKIQLHPQNQHKRHKGYPKSIKFR